jgi:hypothetical protein
MVSAESILKFIKQKFWFRTELIQLCFAAQQVLFLLLILSWVKTTVQNQHEKGQLFSILPQKISFSFLLAWLKLRQLFVQKRRRHCYIWKNLRRKKFNFNWKISPRSRNRKNLFILDKTTVDSKLLNLLVVAKTKIFKYPLVKNESFNTVLHKITL